MALQYSVAVNHARLDAVESTIGSSAKLRIYTGAVPVNCATVAAGTLLVDIALPVDWMTAAAATSKAKSGTWSAAAIAAGTAGYFRITDTAGSTAHAQGTCGQGSGDLSLDNTNIAVSQVVTVSSFSLNAANT
jgi:hypothetical protein